jgi:hypothetical protein
MKNVLLALAFLFLVSYTKAVQHNADSSVLYSYSYMTAAWGNESKYIYVWDAQCHNQTQYLIFSWNAQHAGWDSTTRYEYSYDQQGHLIQTLYSISRGGSTLVPSYKINYYYNGNLQTNYTLASWNSTTSTYQDDSRYIYHYIGSTDKYDTMWIQRLNLNNMWEVNSVYTYAYNAAGDDTLEMDYGYTPQSGYLNSKWIQMSYTPDHKVAVYTLNMWNDTASAYTPYIQYTNTYNTNGGVSEEITKMWNNSASSWRNFTKKTFLYKSNTDLDTILTYDWFPSTSSWLLKSKQPYYSGCLFRTGIEETAADQVQLYPNPASGSIQLSLPSLTAPTTVSITNIQGQQLSQQPVNRGMNTIRIADLAPGMYLLQWLDGAQLRTKQFIKE